MGTTAYATQANIPPLSLTGFVSNPKRFNVSVTRAKSLVRIPGTMTIIPVQGFGKDVLCLVNVYDSSWSDEWIMMSGCI